MPPFALFRPDSRAQLFKTQAEAPAPVAFHGAGTGVFEASRKGLRPGFPIGPARYPGLAGIGVAEGALRLDAVPGLRAASEKIATARIRRNATQGGDLIARRAG